MNKLLNSSCSNFTWNPFKCHCWAWPFIFTHLSVCVHMAHELPWQTWRLRTGNVPAEKTLYIIHLSAAHQFRLVYDSTLYSSYFTLRLPHKMQKCLVQSLLKHTTWKRIGYSLLSGMFLQGSLPRETRELVPSHTSCCVESQEGRNQVGVQQLFKKLTSFTCKSRHRADLNKRKGSSCASTCGRELVGIPALCICRYFQKAFTHALPEAKCHLSPFNTSEL